MQASSRSIRFLFIASGTPGQSSPSGGGGGPRRRGGGDAAGAAGTVARGVEEGAGGVSRGTDAQQTDLRRWHALEVARPELFGRMHVLYCQRAADDDA